MAMSPSLNSMTFGLATKEESIHRQRDAREQSGLQCNRRRKNCGGPLRSTGTVKLNLPFASNALVWTTIQADTGKLIFVGVSNAHGELGKPFEPPSVNVVPDKATP